MNKTTTTTRKPISASAIHNIYIGNIFLAVSGWWGRGRRGLVEDTWITKYVNKQHKPGNDFGNHERTNGKAWDEEPQTTTRTMMFVGDDDDDGDRRCNACFSNIKIHKWIENHNFYAQCILQLLRIHQYVHTYIIRTHYIHDSFPTMRGEGLMCSFVFWLDWFCGLLNYGELNSTNTRLVLWWPEMVGNYS